MEDLTCMDYLLHCAGHSKHEQITQALLLNAFNEFKNIWNLVKKLQSVSRIDVNKITRFLDGVQDGLVKSENKKWEAVSIQCVNAAEHEYRQIKKYIRPSYLDDYMVVNFINISQSKPKADVKSQTNAPAPSVQHMRKQSFRNNQIYKQYFLKVGKHVSVDRRVNKSSQNSSLNKTNADGREIGDGQENASTDNKNDKAGKNHGTIKERNYSSEVISKSNAENKLSESSITTADYKPMKKDKHTEDQELNKANTKIVSKDKADQKAQQLLVNNVQSQKTSNVKAADDDELTKELDKETENEEQSDFARDGNGYHQNGKVTASKQMKANGVSIEMVKSHHGYHKFKNRNLDPLLETPEDNEIDNMNDSKHETNMIIKCKQSNDCQNNMISLHKSDNETLNGKQAIQRQTSEETTSDGTMKAANQNVGMTAQDDTGCTDKPSTKGTESSYDDYTTPIISDSVTDTSAERNYDEIIMKLVGIFEVDWGKAFKILTCCTPSNGLKNSISFLGEVLKVSSQKVTTCVENMPEKIKSSAEESNRTLCKQKEDFLKSQLPNLHGEFNIVYGNPGEVNIVQAYAAKCVEISWIMSIQNPPLIFDYESRPMLLEDLFLLFNPYKNNGHLIQYVVWPAVRRCDTGEVIAKGIAEFR